MGVNNLKKIITLMAHECIKPVTLNDFRNMNIAFDGFQFIYASVFDYRTFSGGFDKLNKWGEIVTHLEFIFDKVIKLHRNNVMSLWIFDGKQPDIKREELAKRRLAKQELQERYEASPNYNPEIPVCTRNFTVNKTVLKNLYKMLKLMGVHFIVANGEAENLASLLNRNAVVDGLITEDWDALPFGCQNLIKGFNTKRDMYTIDINKLLAALELTHEQFIDVCILLKTDYCPTIQGLSGLEAYYMYYEFKDMNLLVNHLITINSKRTKPKYIIPENFLQRWRQAKEYYLTSMQQPNTPKKVVWYKPQKEKLLEFLCDECLFDRNRMVQKVDQLMQLYYRYANYKKAAYYKQTFKIINTINNSYIRSMNNYNNYNNYNTAFNVANFKNNLLIDENKRNEENKKFCLLQSAS